MEEQAARRITGLDAPPRLHREVLEAGQVAVDAGQRPGQLRTQVGRREIEAVGAEKVTLAMDGEPIANGFHIVDQGHVVLADRLSKQQRQLPELTPVALRSNPW